MKITDTHGAEPPKSSRASDEWLITHDFGHTMGGAERCTAVIAQMLPTASAWVVGGNKTILGELFGSRKVDSFLPIGLLGYKLERFITPALYPLIRLIRPSDKNIIASSYAMAHLRRSRGIKVIYCHSPFRQIYSGLLDYFPKFPLGGAILEFLLGPFRAVDRRAAQEADAIIATNSIVADRVRRYWKRPADAVIPPPIDTDLFCPIVSPSRVYYLWVGRIVEPYKRLGLVLEAFRSLPDEKLIVVGEGRDRTPLESQAPANVQFVGGKSGTDLASYYANAKAVIFPSADDFGMVPLEAMSAGTPVIGYSGGGARETIIHGETGVLYQESTPECLLQAISSFTTAVWDYKLIREYGQRFSHDAFVKRVSEVILGATTQKMRKRQKMMKDHAG